MIYDIEKAKALTYSDLNTYQIDIVKEINASIEKYAWATFPWTDVIVYKWGKPKTLQKDIIEIANRYRDAGYLVTITEASKIYDIMLYWGDDVEEFKKFVGTWREAREGVSIYEAY